MCCALCILQDAVIVCIYPLNYSQRPYFLEIYSKCLQFCIYQNEINACIMHYASVIVMHAVVSCVLFVCDVWLF